VFSLHATKPFAIGEGGIIVTRSKSLAEKLRRLSNFGFNENKEAADIGFNGKMQELNAAIGIRQLKRLDQNIKSRQEKLLIYKKLLTPLKYEFQINDENSSLAFVSVLGPGEENTNLFHSELIKIGIGVRRYYNPPLHTHDSIKRKSKAAVALSVTEDMCKRILSLPIHDGISVDDIFYICTMTTLQNK